MEDEQCLNGCTGESTESANQNYHDVLTASGERKIRGSDSGLPPLPEPLDMPPPDQSTQDSARASQPKVLPGGCYYIRLIPTSLHTPARFQYEGSLRIQRSGAAMMASGDLYKKDFCQSPTFCPSFSDQDDRHHDIPVFPRQQYAYYLRVTRLCQEPGGGESIVLEMEPYRFDYARRTWGRGDPLSAAVKFSTGPDGIHYWRGDIQTGSGIVLGQLMMVRISPYLRQAVIEIDRVPAANSPYDKHQGHWEAVFHGAGWQVSVNISNDDVEEPEDYSWSNAELHQKMLKYRETVDLDKQWHYHLLAVRKLDDEAFGVMYDNTISGVNDIPREGAAIASQVVFPDEACWGECKQKPFGECQIPYIRTAIHEIGHAMMLYHPDNPYENYIMQKTVQIAHNAAPPQRFPHNVEWSFSPRDIRLLCHLPDIAIRPGGVSFGTPHDRLPVNVRDEVVEAEGLELRVSPLHEIVPIGAPVRINFTLTNRSDKPRLVPGSLSMKTGHVSGRVIDPLGSAQDFATIIRYTRDVMPQELQPADFLSHSVTLLWGTEGPLFPTSGYYRVLLELRWDFEGVQIRIAGSAGLMVTPPKDDDHARAALRIFSNPDTILALAIGGEHLEKGNEIIAAAVNNPVLKPHYDLIAAKRESQRFFKKQPNFRKTSEIVNEKTVMSPAEVVRLAKILRNFAPETPKATVTKMYTLIQTKAREVSAEDKVAPLLDEIQQTIDK